KTQPATGETYPKSDLFNKAAFTVSDLCMAAFTNPHTVRTLCKAERALYCFVFHSNPRVEDLLRVCRDSRWLAG
ncbi:hypothetical protein, partial [Klebsiella pneumoniae]|uniref:hypothetical protein n=1 Tax=Klebsiella pneumoniae TaxID=573 RepID=UPI001F0409A6